MMTNKKHPFLGYAVLVLAFVCVRVACNSSDPAKLANLERRVEALQNRRDDRASRLKIGDTLVIESGLTTAISQDSYAEMMNEDSHLLGVDLEMVLQGIAVLLSDEPTVRVMSITQPAARIEVLTGEQKGKILYASEEVLRLFKLRQEERDDDPGASRR